MSETNHSSITSKLIWLLVLTVIFLGFPWLDKNRSGPLLKTYACHLALSSDPQVVDDVLILGSSRSGAAFDTFYLESLLNFKQKSNYSVERFNMTNEDKLSSYFLLKNRIKQSKAPKVLVLQPMMKKYELGVRVTNSRIKTRHAGLIPAGELIKLKKDFHLDRKQNGLLDQLRIYVDRYTALLYGLIKQPLTNVLSSENCQKPKMRTEKNAWPSAHYTASSDIDTEIAKAKAFLMDEEKAAKVNKQFKKALKNWKGRLFDNDQSGKIFSQFDINELKLIIELAKAESTSIILAPLPSYNQVFTKSDLEELEALFPQVIVYDAIGHSEGLLTNFWKDPNHVSKEGAMLTSAQLAKVVYQELTND